MTGRMGSTTPMPMKAANVAKAVAHIAGGKCEKRKPPESVVLMPAIIGFATPERTKPLRPPQRHTGRGNGGAAASVRRDQVLVPATPSDVPIFRCNASILAYFGLTQKP